MLKPIRPAMTDGRVEPTPWVLPKQIRFPRVYPVWRSMAKKTATKGRTKVKKVMHEYKEGTLKSGSGKKVASRKQAVAVALSEARKSGARIPKKKSSSKS